MNDNAEFDDDQLSPVLPFGSNIDGGNRRHFAFDNPTGICRRRVACVAEVAARGWGIIVPDTAMTVLRTPSRPVASRALGTLAEVGEARRVRVTGTNKYAWGTTPLLARQYPGMKPGTRFFPPKGIEVWKPYPEFTHNQLALRVLCGLAAPKDFLTEPEIGRRVPEGSHIADGVVRLVIRGQSMTLELQIEKSRKTGAEGGWAKLARRIVSVCADQELASWATPLGKVNGVLVVASIADGRRVAARVMECTRGKALPPVFFFFAEIRANDGSPIRRYEDVHPSSPLGPVQLWHIGRDLPFPAPLAEIWTPPRKISDGLDEQTK